MVRSAPLLQRVAFRMNRLAEFCSEKELVAQTGHAAEEWPLVVLKELCDNALDECEEAQIAPEIDITVSTATGAITVSDNGRGIPAETVRDVLDYSYRVSSREAYVSPTRGAQGNALKTLIPMPFVLNHKTGTTVIDAAAVRHTITFRVDQLRQEPVIDYEPLPLVPGENGTRLTVFWPDSASSILDDAEERFLQIADDFAWINPHLRIRVEWDGEIRVDRQPSCLDWEKWRACDPTSAWWYDLPRLKRYIGAHVNRDRERDDDRTVREFVSELRGFSGSAKQKAVLEETKLGRAPLSSLFDRHGEAQPGKIEALLGCGSEAQ